MRVTFVLPEFNLSGGVRVAAIYAAHLRRKGHAVTAIALHDPPPSLRRIVGSLLRGHGWPKPGQGGKPSHFDDLDVQRLILYLTDRPNPDEVPDADVVVATWWETAEWITKLPASKGARVHFVQGYEVFAGKPEVIDAVYALPTPKIVVSGWLRDIVRDKFHQEPIALVPNAVDLNLFHAPARGKQAVPTVGTIYSAVGIKGTDICLRAIDLAAKQLPGLKLVAMSNYPLEPGLPLPPGTDFILHARDQQLRENYARCDAWLSGSREEGFGLPILEAMACRTPVIATPAGAAPELLAKGGGILVPPENPEAMAEAIIKICSFPEAEWRALSDKALATATGFTWDDAAELFEATLQKLTVGRA